MFCLLVRLVVWDSGMALISPNNMVMQNVREEMGENTPFTKIVDKRIANRPRDPREGNNIIT